MGNLVRVFQTMAHEVQNREQHLEGLVRERTTDLRRKNEQLETARRRVDEELRIARSLQGAILPRLIPEHEAYAGHALMTPAQELGGDFYDCFLLPDGRLGVVMADVSGKGVPAAFFMAIARTVTRAAAQEHGEAGRCLREVNEAICAQNPHDLFVTLFYGILDPASGRFDYANAGHNAPFVVGEDGGIGELRRPGRRGGRHAGPGLHGAGGRADSGRHAVPLHRRHLRGHEPRRRGVRGGTPEACPGEGADGADPRRGGQRDERGSRPSSATRPSPTTSRASSCDISARARSAATSRSQRLCVQPWP